MIGLGDPAGQLADVCRNLLQFGIGLALQSTLLLGLGLLAGRHLRRHGPAVSSFVYQSTLLALLVGAVLAMPVGGHLGSPWSVTLPSAHDGLGEEGVPALRSAQEGMRGFMSRPPLTSGPGSDLAPIHTGASITSEAERNTDPWYSNHHRSRPDAAASMHLSPPLRRRPPIGWLYIALVGVWIAGLAWLLAGLALCYRCTGRLKRDSAPAGDAAQEILRRLCTTRGLRPPLLQVSASVRSPALTGLWGPAILLPASYQRDFDGMALRVVLAHELAHLARRDCGWVLLLRLTCAVGWVQPLLWMLGRRLEESSEEVCDRDVLQQASPRVYARCLLDLAERLSPPGRDRAAVVAMATHRSSLERRIRYILESSRQAPLLLTARLRIAIAIAALSGATLSLWVAMAAAAPPETAPKDRLADRPPARRQMDPRLEQRVTFTALGEPLEVILRRLSEQTGISFSFEGRDVGDRKAIILVRDVPLKELKTTLAATFFGFYWREQKRRSENQIGYVLFQDLRSRQLEAGLGAVADRMTRRLRQLLGGLHNGGRGLDEEERTLLRGTGTHMTLELLDKLTPGQQRALFANGYLHTDLDTGVLTPELEAHWTQDARKRLEHVPEPWASQPGTLHLADSPSFSIRDLPNVTFDLHRWDGADGRHTVDLTINTSAAPGLAVGWAEIPLAQDGDSHFTELPDVKEFLEGKPLQQVQSDPELDRRVAALTPQQAHELDQARAHVRPIIIDGREIPIREGSRRYQLAWLPWLRLLVDRARLAVVSDYFTEGAQGTTAPADMTVREALEEARRTFHRRWVKSGSLLSFRHEHWRQLQSAEPPQRVLDAVKAAFKQKGRLDLEDLALAGELDLAQVTVASSLKMPCDWVLQQHPATMRLLHALAPVERRLAQGNGLTLGALGSPTAQECFKTAAWTVAPTLEEAQLGQVVFLIRQQVDERNNLSLAFRWTSPHRELESEAVDLKVGER